MNLSFGSLPSLPHEVKRLISWGIYGLYKIKHTEIRYLLVTNTTSRYVLNKDGSIVSRKEGVPPAREMRGAEVVLMEACEKDREMAVKIGTNAPL